MIMIEERVSPTTLKAHRRQYPWLDYLIGTSSLPGPLVRMTTARVDKDLGTRQLVSLQVFERSCRFTYERWMLYEGLVLLDADGQFLRRVEAPPSEGSIVRSWLGPFDRPRSIERKTTLTIEAVLQQYQEDAKRVHYAVSIQPYALGSDEWVHTRTTLLGYNVREIGRVVTIYKPPKTFTLGDWLEECVRREEQQIRTAIAEIDAEIEPAA